MADKILHLTREDEIRIESYAKALADMMYRLSGENPIAKRYDPMTIENGIMHSYTFDMKDGGRHHHVSDYTSIDEILEVLLSEAVAWL